MISDCKMKTKLLFLMTAVLMIATASAAKKVHTLGDSTMAPYDESATVTRGWGMYFGNFLTNGWTSINYAKGGRDSRGGYNELWQTAKKNVEAGDYVIITFGHNDEKNSGMDGVALYNYYKEKGDNTAAAAVDQRGTVPSTTYKEWLGKIIDEVKELGATPIICSPVCRSYFTGSKIRRNGRHDLGDSFSVLTADGIKEKQSVPADDHTMDYAYHSQKLAEEKGISFIDLTTATAELYESYGDAKCHEYLFDGEGSTHFNTTGAVLVARECARLMKAQGIMASDITLPTDLTVTPETGDLGEAYKGQTLQKEFTLNGFGLSPETGTVSITATDGIELSFDKKEWTKTLTADYSGSTLVKTFYAQLMLTANGETTGTITVRQGDKTIEIPVKATAVTLEGGTEVKAYWRLEKDDSYELTGPATPIAQTFQGMYVQRYSNPNAKTEWPEWTGYDAARKMQRNLLTGDNWPADEIDDNPDRYIQWGLKPAAGTELKIDLISLFAAGCGGNGMCCHIYYSTDNFATRTTIFEMKKMPANNPQFVEAKPVLTVKDGQELLVRVYPWYNGAASGKTICLSDLTIHGMAVETTGIRQVSTENSHTTAFFTVDGRQHTQMQRGLNIVRMADGNIKKIIY
jgi:lysophospholipase L1-like esterase